MTSGPDFWGTLGDTGALSHLDPEDRLYALRNAKAFIDAVRMIDIQGRIELKQDQSLAAFKTYKTLFRLGDPLRTAVSALFNILHERGRFAAAERLLPALARARNPGSSARGRTVLALLRRDSDEANRILWAKSELCPPTLTDELHDQISRALRAELRRDDTMAGFRHLAIAGVARVGSTIFGVILGSMPGYAFAGETHWLTEARIGTSKVSILNASPNQWKYCRICKDACSCFTSSFRLALASDATGWYAKIAERLGVNNVVSSDKNAAKLWRLDPLFRFDLLVLFKNPIQQVQSNLNSAIRKDPITGRQKFEADIESNLEHWAASYLAHLKLIRA